MKFMMMKSNKLTQFFLPLILLVLLASGLSAQTDSTTKKPAKKESETELTIKDAGQCFILTKQEWGNKCGDKASLLVEFTNNCKEKMDIKFAIKRTEGRWNIGTKTNVKPGEMISAGEWICNATGGIKYWARPSNQPHAGDWPSDKDIRADKSKGNGSLKKK